MLGLSIHIESIHSEGRPKAVRSEQGNLVTRDDFSFLVRFVSNEYTTFTIPAGTPWNGQSGPSWVYDHLPQFHEDYDAATLAHDALYGGIISWPAFMLVRLHTMDKRWLADQVMLQMMLQRNYIHKKWYKKQAHKIRAHIMYWSVRLFGAKYYEGS